jgi:hypothetical protein
LVGEEGGPSVESDEHDGTAGPHRQGGGEEQGESGYTHTPCSITGPGARSVFTPISERDSPTKKVVPVYCTTIFVIFLTFQ